jgi:hypothetical protein
LPAAIGDRLESILIMIEPFAVSILTVRVSPAASAGGWLVGQADATGDTDPDAAADCAAADGAARVGLGADAKVQAARLAASVTTTPTANQGERIEPARDTRIKQRPPMRC